MFWGKLHPCMMLSEILGNPLTLIKVHIVAYIDILKLPLKKFGEKSSFMMICVKFWAFKTLCYHGYSCLRPKTLVTMATQGVLSIGCWGRRVAVRGSTTNRPSCWPVTLSARTSWWLSAPSWRKVCCNCPSHSPAPNHRRESDETYSWTYHMRPIKHTCPNYHTPPFLISRIHNCNLTRVEQLKCYPLVLNYWHFSFVLR